MSKDKLNDFIKEATKNEMQMILEKLRGGFNLAKLKQLTAELVDEDSKKYQQILAYITDALGAPMGKGSSRLVWTLSGNKVLKFARYDSRVPKLKGAGRAQNKAEVDVYTDPAMAPIVAKIFDYDPKFFWIISEIVKPFNYYRTLEDLGVPVWVLENFIRDFIKYKTSPKEILNDAIDRLEMSVGDVQFFIYSQKEELKKKEEILANSEKKDPEIIASIRFYKENIADKEKQLQIFKQELDGIQKIASNEKFVNLLEATLEMHKKIGFNIRDLVQIEHFGQTADGRYVILDYGYNDEIGRTFYK